MMAPKRYLTDKDITAERIRAQRRLALSPCEDCEFSGYSCWVGDNSGKCAPCAEQGGTIAQCGVLVDHYRVIPRRVSKKNAESPPSTKMAGARHNTPPPCPVPEPTTVPSSPKFGAGLTPPITPQVAQAVVPPPVPSVHQQSQPYQAPPPQPASTTSIADLLTIGGRVAVLEKDMKEVFDKNVHEMLEKKMEVFEKNVKEELDKDVHEVLEIKMNDLFEKKIHTVFAERMDEVFAKRMNEAFAKNVVEVFEKFEQKINGVFEKKIKVSQGQVYEVFEKKTNEVFETKMNEVFERKMNSVSEKNASEIVEKKMNEAFERVEKINGGFESKLEQLSSSVDLVMQEKESCMNIPSNKRSLRIMFD